ncbi:MAG: hypothetical protein WBW92_05115 [Rhodanobacteraceae bacterium]
MKVSELHTTFLQEFGALLPGWKFVASQRRFKRNVGTANWLLHLAFINHEHDFDVIGDVAVEFLAARKRVAIIGAQLGNIAGVGQTRHAVSSPARAASAARSLLAEFNQVGLRFLERYSAPAFAAAILRAGGPEARLISPFVQNHASQVAALQELGAPPNNLFEADGSAAAQLKR